MKNWSIFFLLSLSLTVSAQNAKEVVRKADENARGKTSQAEMTIQVIRPTWKREMDLKAWTKGNDYTLIVVTAPARDKGIVFLKRGKEVWNWVPAIERNIKLPPSMMSQSWMGTDFTNDDLVREASIVNDYRQQFMADTTIDGHSCYQVDMRPLPEAAVVWGRVILCIEKKDFLMLYASYYDEDGKLMNILHASQISILGGRNLPSRIEMIPADKPSQKTVMLYKKLIFDQPIPENYFSTQNMSKVQ